MYGIVFNFKTDEEMEIDEECAMDDPYSLAYQDLTRFLSLYGFKVAADNLFINPTANAVTTITTVQKAYRELPWLLSNTRDVHMLRIEESTNLMPAIQ